jgi:hypothetical protein
MINLFINRYKCVLNGRVSKLIMHTFILLNYFVTRSELERRGWRFYPRSTSHLDKYKYNFPENYSVQHVSIPLYNNTVLKFRLNMHKS